MEQDERRLLAAFLIALLASGLWYVWEDGGGGGGGGGNIPAGTLGREKGMNSIISSIALVCHCLVEQSNVAKNVVNLSV